MQASLYLERGFPFGDEPTLSLPLFVTDLVDAHNLHKFVEHLSHLVTTLVREFFANLDENEESWKVRSKTMSFSSIAINAFYRVQDDADLHDRFAKHLSQAQLNEILQKLTISGTS